LKNNCANFVLCRFLAQFFALVVHWLRCFMADYQCRNALAFRAGSQIPGCSAGVELVLVLLVPCPQTRSVHTVNQRLVVFRPVGDGVKRCAHDADLKRMVVIRSPSPQLVPFKLHRFGKQRRLQV